MLRGQTGGVGERPEARWWGGVTVSHRVVRGRLKAIVPGVILFTLCLAQASSVYTVNCTYTQDPEQYTEQDERARDCLLYTSRCV